MLDQRERRRFTPEEYLMLEEQALTKSEYYDGEIFAMTGGTLNHNLIQNNIFSALRQGVPSGCKVYTADVRLLVEKNTLYTYPDILVVCGAPRLLGKRKDTVTDARVIVEILSPSTETYDRNLKFNLYRGLPSLEYYVLVAQDEFLVDRHHRQPNGDWVWRQSTRLEDNLELPTLDLSIPLAEIYANLEP